MTMAPMMISRSSSSTASFSSFSKSQKKQLLICPASTIVLRRNSKAFLIRATASGSKSKRKQINNNGVLMVNPLEAKQMAVKQMQEIQAKERSNKLRRIEAINGAWAVIGLMVGLVIESRTGNSIPQQLTGYWMTVTGFFA
ncbi:hypothetical protein ZOSMA_43G00260 [Zostera marina]|uniref:Uncharacterized protein n=1 Tax=Zostera marina TaxID=29655 RepID=A0A0K9P3N4_ZOSMR|nr:hypothetical protein ZOSMA_43G00260 [Zostera marina]